MHGITSSVFSDRVWRNIFPDTIKGKTDETTFSLHRSDCSVVICDGGRWLFVVAVNGECKRASLWSDGVGIFIKVL